MVNGDFTTVDSWCNAEGDTFLVGDVNGDHNDDWICHHSDGSVCVKYNALIFGGILFYKYSNSYIIRLMRISNAQNKL